MERRHIQHTALLRTATYIFTYTTFTGYCKTTYGNKRYDKMNAGQNWRFDIDSNTWREHDEV